MDQDELVKQVGSKLSHIDRKLMALLGMEMVEISSNRCVTKLTVRDDLVNSARVCQGGIICALADQALAYACMSCNLGGMTLSANVNFTRPAPLGDVLTATAEVSFDGGGRTLTANVEIENQDGVTVAQMTGMWMKVKEQIINV